MEKSDLFLKFVQKADIVHKGRYRYNDTNYIDSKHLIGITCLEHGEFKQTPAAHIRGDNCPLCSNANRGSKKRLTQEEVIERFRKVHGDKYDYSKVIFRTVNDKVDIICEKHGLFSLNVSNHINGQGCPKCANKGLTLEEKIALFKEKHEDKYDYSLIKENFKFSDKIDIICKKHGLFSMRASKHLIGHNCPLCAKESGTSKRTMSHEEFINRCEKINNGLDDFSKVEYVKMHEQVIFICKKHGEYSMRPYDYLHMHRCPKCNESRLEREVELFLKKKGIEYVGQKRFDWLGKQSLDFYLPKYNVAIECQGNIHFRNGKNTIYFDYDSILERDERKYQLCKENGLEVIYFTREKKEVIKKIDFYNDKIIVRKLKDFEEKISFLKDIYR